MHMMALRYGDDILVIDSGMMFPEDDLLGVDFVTPDLTYLRDNRQHVRALLLTHGHEDHIGAVPFFLADLNVPVYGTAFTLALVERRLEEFDLPEEAEFNTVKPGQKVEIISCGVTSPTPADVNEINTIYPTSPPYCTIGDNYCTHDVPCP